MGKLLIGTAGSPHSAKPRGSVSGIRKLRELGLDAMELEFVRGVFPGEKMSGEIYAAAMEDNILLTAHGPYYINLCSMEPDKTEASVQRILRTARVGWLCGALSFTFHAAFLMGRPHEEVYQEVEKHLRNIAKILGEENNPIAIRPELTGKHSQLGSFEDILGLSRDIESVEPCVDFAHYHARTGNGNTYEAFASMLEEMRRTLGPESIKNMHIHISGIEYGPKGERKHLNLRESDMNYTALLQVLRDYDAAGILICESPNLEDDALLLKETYEGL